MTGAVDKKRPDPSAQIAEVLRLSLVEGLSIHAIRKKTHISRKRIRKILGRALTPREKANAQTPSPQVRTSILDPYLAVIRKLIDDTPELRAPAVLERLRALGYQGGVSIVRDRLRTLRPRSAREAFLTLDFQPGAAAQIDWADFGFALPGCPRRVSAFVMALCYSRYLYLEFTLSQAMGTFLRCMDRGLAFLGGTTTADIFDNMKTVVRSHTPRATVFNPRFLEYAKARGRFAVIACNPRRGNEKGRVERPIGFVRERFWPGRIFKDLLDLNVQAAAWRDNFANNRVHDETGKVPALVFAHEEKRLLKPLPDTPFDTDDIESQGVTKTFRVTFDRNRYSVPWRLVGQTVVVRANDQTVSAYLGQKQVALHTRSWNVAQDIEHPSHKEGLLTHKPRAAAEILSDVLGCLGEMGRTYFKILAAGGRSLQRETVRLTFLVEIFGPSETREAVSEVMRTGHVGAEYVEYVLRHKKGIQPSPPPLRLGDPALDNIVLPEPDLSVYDQPEPEPDLSVYDRHVPSAMTLDPAAQGMRRK